MARPRWKEIADGISDDIRRGALVPGDPLPSETELAQQWNVSRMTAHRAMYELQQQGVVIRKRRAGTFVATPRPRHTGYVAIFLNTRDFLEQEYLAGIRAGLPDDFDLLFCDIQCDPRREADYLRRMAGQTDGIICIPTCDPANTGLFRRSLEAGSRIICMDCVPDHLEVDAVISDNYDASRAALQFLIRRGHRRIAHFTGSRASLSSLRERYQAYRHAMAEVGCADPHRWVREFPFDLGLPVGRDGSLLGQAVHDALFALMHAPDRPTALFCVHDYLLAAVLRACRSLAVRIPEDLEIVSFNDCPPVVPFLPGNIHRISQRAYEIGHLAAVRLVERIKGANPSPEIIRIAPILHVAEVVPAPASTPGPHSAHPGLSGAEAVRPSLPG